MLGTMINFTEAEFTKRLKDLKSSQKSIQTLSLWLIHHQKHATAVVKIWAKEMFIDSESKQLSLMYLVNDVIQNGRKKGPEYKQEFGKELARLFKHISNSCTAKTRQSLIRLLNIWEERGVYRKSIIDEFKNAFEGANRSTLVEESKYSHVTLSSKTPKPEELIKALNELKNAPSSDRVVREQISKLPLDISDVSLLNQLKDKDKAEDLLHKINDSFALLADYNTRLECEIKYRKEVVTMLKDFIKSHRDLLDRTEQKLEEYQGELQKMCKAWKVVNLHIQKLQN